MNSVVSTHTPATLISSLPFMFLEYNTGEGLCTRVLQLVVKERGETFFEKKEKKATSVIYLPSGVRDTHLHRIARDLCATFSPPTPRSEPLRSTPAMSTCRAPQRHFRVRFCGVPPENSGAPSWTAAPELSHVALGVRSSYQLYLSPSALSPGGLLVVSTHASI